MVIWNYWHCPIDRVCFCHYRHNLLYAGKPIWTFLIGCMKRCELLLRIVNGSVIVYDCILMLLQENAELIAMRKY